jgi:hypothetical protein
MARPLNMNPEDYARQVVEDQQAYIESLEAQLAGGGGGGGDGGGADVAANVFDFGFSAATSEPPGSSQMRFESLDASFVTKIWVHKLTTTGIDIMNIFTLYHEGDRIYAQTKSDGDCYARFTLSADPIFNTSYVEMPVIYVASGLNLKGGQPAILAVTAVR